MSRETTAPLETSVRVLLLQPNVNPSSGRGRTARCPEAPVTTHTMASHPDEISRVDPSSGKLMNGARAPLDSDQEFEVTDYDLIEEEPHSRVRPIQTTLRWTGAIAAPSAALAYEKAVREVLRTTQFFEATHERLYAHRPYDVEELVRTITPMDRHEALLQHVRELEAALEQRVAEDDAFISQLMREHERTLESQTSLYRDALARLAKEQAAHQAARARIAELEAACESDAPSPARLKR